MSWTVEPTSGQGGEKPPAGNHPAVLVGIIDLGTQREQFGDQEARDNRKLYFVWELVGKKKSGSSQNHTIGLDLTLSGHEKSKLRGVVEARTGRPMGAGYKLVDEELGKPCLLNVTANAKGFPKVSAVAAVPDGFTTPPAQIKPVALSIDDYRRNSWNLVIPDWVPWLYGDEIPVVIRKSKEYRTENPHAPVADQPVESLGGPIPF